MVAARVEAIPPFGEGGPCEAWWVGSDDSAMKLELDSRLAMLEAAPMSRRKAMLLVLLIDEAIDAGLAPGGDLLAHRRTVATNPDLAIVMELAGMREGGARLVVEAVEGETQSEAEYMVSLYNAGTVPRLMIARDGSSEEALPLLRRAVAALRGT